MSRTGWKKSERDAASLLHGKRFPANQGGVVDVESDLYVAQVKSVKRFSLLKLERECREIERVGIPKNKIGLVLIKRSAGKGKETDWLVCMTAGMFREMSGPLPTEAP